MNGTINNYAEFNTAFPQSLYIITTYIYILSIITKQYLYIYMYNLQRTTKLYTILNMYLKHYLIFIYENVLYLIKTIFCIFYI